MEGKIRPKGLLDEIVPEIPGTGGGRNDDDITHVEIGPGISRPGLCYGTPELAHAHTHTPVSMETRRWIPWDGLAMAHAVGVRVLADGLDMKRDADGNTLEWAKCNAATVLKQYCQVLCACTPERPPAAAAHAHTCALSRSRTLPRLSLA